MFETNTQIYSLTERYLFIPAGGSDIDWVTHPQTKVNSNDFTLFLLIFRGVASVDNWRGEYSFIRVQIPQKQWISEEITEAKCDV